MNYTPDELLDATLAHIKAHPKEWNQISWRCSTGMCFAGTACSLAGGVWATKPDHYGAHFLLAKKGEHFQWGHFGKDGTQLKVVSAGDRAADLLDLTHEENNRLFDAGATLDDIREVVTEIKARHAIEARHASERN